MPGRGLITRRPGSAGPLSLIVGVAVVIASLAYFISSLQVDRVTFAFDGKGLTERWNEAAAAASLPTLTINIPRSRPDESGDLVFGEEWSEGLSLRGRVDAATSLLVELTVIGDPDLVDGGSIVEAMDLLIRVTEPDLGEDERLATLQELGVVGGDPTADLRATRGDTDYVVASANQGSTVGMSAAPYSSLASGRR